MASHMLFYANPIPQQDIHLCANISLLIAMRWGDLLYVFPCVILFLCFPVLWVLRLPRLGKRELTLVLFVRLFDLCLFGFVGFLFLLGLGRATVCNCGTPWTFLLPFFVLIIQQGNILLCVNISLLQAIRCYYLIIYRSKVIFHRVLIFPGKSHTLLYTNHILHQRNILSCANISLLKAMCFLYASHILHQCHIILCGTIFLLQAKRCWLLVTMYCSKVIFYRVLIFALLQAKRFCVLIINWIQVLFYRAIIFPCCKPNAIACSSLTAAR